MKLKVVSMDSGKHYTIAVGSDGYATCSCPAYLYSPAENKYCKHIERATRTLSTFSRERIERGLASGEPLAV